MTEKKTDLLQIAERAVDIASGIMRTMRPGTLTAKGDRDMASEVDFAVEREVRAYLAEATPEIHFLGEEEGYSGREGETLWALDPVDGTVNFVHGSPLCGISLGLIVGERSELGVVDLPFLGMRYSAARGLGAFRNGERISASGTERLEDAVVAIGDFATGTGSTELNRRRIVLAERLAASAQRVRMHGSAAIDLVWVADGRIDAMVMFSNKPWDTAAGVVIAAESGVRVVDADGNPHTARSTATVAAPSALIDRLVELLPRT